MKKILTFLSFALFLCACRKDIKVASSISTTTSSELTLDRYFTSEDFRGSKMRGFNLGPVETWAHLKAKDIPTIKATGANHGRAWIQINHAPGSYQYFWCDYKGNKIASPLPVIDSLLKIAEANNFYIILTVEVFPKQAATDWWKDSKRKTAIINFWRDSLAVRYKSKKIIAAYDLMNEPRVNPTLTKGMTRAQTDAEYMRFYADIINGVRSVDGGHCIAVEVLDNQMLARVAALPHRNLIYSPHGYSPLRITNQGAISSYTIRQPYPNYVYKEPDGTMYTENYFGNVTYWRNPAEFQAKYNAVIWVGEFSCINWAPKNTYGEWTSTRWIEDAINYMESLGWSWSYHAWREYQGWDAEFPSSWYEANATFTNAKPSSLPPSSARSLTTPTMMVLTKNFSKNSQ